MFEIAKIASLSNPTQYDVEYGSGAALASTAWDFQTMHGCLCDSTWSVGFQEGQRQLGEYFGPDCSMSEWWWRLIVNCGDGLFAMSLQ